MNRLSTATMLTVLFALSAVFDALTPAAAGLWQYSATIDSVTSGEIHDHPRAYLWVPPKCQQVRAVIVAQHNLLEESILLNPKFRQELEMLNVAEVWIMPNIDFTFDFHKGAGDAFDDMMKTLAAKSGYTELVYAPVIPIGHSAAASYPWNFAAWAPQRTLAALSVHGDTPRTNLTGNGAKYPDWGNVTLDGIPGLFTMGQFQWWDKRTQPGLDYVAAHPGTPLAMLPDIGHGHFDTSDAQVRFLAMFVRKAVEYRMPKNSPVDGPVALKPVDPKLGWLVNLWSPDTGRKFAAAPYADYKGDRANAFWCFDEEMAKATEAYGAGRTLTANRSIIYVQAGKVMAPSNGLFRPKLATDEDGRTFRFSSYVVDGTIAPDTDWTDDLAKSTQAKQLTPNVLCGPIAHVDDNKYRIEFDQSGFASAYRSYNAFISTMVPTDWKEVVRPQAAGIFVAHNTIGANNVITFPALADVSHRRPIKLSATASSGLPVAYYVDSGPAIIEGNSLKFTPIPPRSIFPVEVRVVAWQWGRAGASPVKSAEPVYVAFHITKAV